MKELVLWYSFMDSISPTISLVFVLFLPNFMLAREKGLGMKEILCVWGNESLLNIFSSKGGWGVDLVI